MVHRVCRSLPILVTVVALSACGGGTVATPGSSTTSSTQTNGTTSGANVELSITLPTTTASASKARGAAFVSSGAHGLSVAVYASSDTAHANPVAVSTGAVAAGAPGCTSAAPVSCVIPLAVPPSPADDFVATVYNAAPVNGAFASAQVLGIGSISNAAVAANAQNAIALNVLGVPVTGVLQFAQAVNPVVGQPGTYALSLIVLDAASQAIQGTFATPLQLTSTNPSLASFSVNGSGSAAIKTASDSVTLSYGGASGSTTLSLAGAAPFSANSLVFAPAAAIGTLTASPTAVTVGIPSPLYSSSNSFTVSEPGFGGTFTQTNTCGTKASVTPGTVAGPSGTFAVTFGYVPGTDSCSVTVQDGNGQSVTVNVTLVNDS
jgi:hypothetical protein